MVALPVMLSSLMFFLSAILWGWCADRYGRRLTLMITALVTIPVAPLYLLTTDYTMIVRSGPMVYGLLGMLRPVRYQPHEDLASR
jgi:MFS family permease